MLALFSLLTVAFAQKEQIWRCRYEEGSSIQALESANVDVQGVLANGVVDVRVQRPSDVVLIEKYLLDCQVVVADLEAETEAFLAENNAARAKIGGLRTGPGADPQWFTAYHTYDEISAWYRNLAVIYPNYVKFVASVGNNTQGGRPLFAVSIYNYASNVAPKYKAWHTAGIHAREWIAPATAAYVVDQLLDVASKRTDENVTAFVNEVETWVLGLINPDGYVYSWANSSTRQWRKNRKTNSGSTCIGVDENRNFNDHWGQGGSSTNPCDDTYMGPSVASEAEVQTVQRVFLQQTAIARIILAIDWHSYSQLILRPYGWTNSVSPDETRLSTLGTAWRNDIIRATGFNYTSQRSYQLYQTTGSASDWYYGGSNPAGTRRTAGYTIELRPTGSNPGFNLPPAQIAPTGQENWAAAKNFFDSLRRTPLP